MGPYPLSLPSQQMKQWRQSQPSVNGRLLGLSGPYHRHAIGTFNICSRGPTHRSLTNTGGSYKLGGAGLPHTTLRPSQPTVLPFSPKSLTRSPVYQVLSTKPEFKFKGNYGRHVVFQSLDRGLQLRVAIANDLSLAIESSMIDRKVTLM
jgi:hypothetical protein